MKIDIIGDIHGCFQELTALLEKLGYYKQNGSYQHADNRVPVFVGDLTDRGPNSLETIALVHQMVITDKSAQYVPGNHCNKLYRYFLGNNVQEKHGLETTVAEYKVLSKQEQISIRDKFVTLYEQADIYQIIPEVQAIIAHAGIQDDLIGRFDKKAETFVLYGDITGDKHPDGRPIRRDWAQEYHGERWIIYGHTPVKEARIVNRTVNIDLGCVFGNQLAAFQLPEETVVSVKSKQPYQAEKFIAFDE